MNWSIELLPLELSEMYPVALTDDIDDVVFTSQWEVTLRPTSSDLPTCREQVRASSATEAISAAAKMILQDCRDKEQLDDALKAMFHVTANRVGAGFYFGEPFSGYMRLEIKGPAQKGPPAEEAISTLKSPGANEGGE